MKRLYRQIVLITSILIAIFAMVGCGKKSEHVNTYSVYYASSDGYTIVSDKYETEETDSGKLVEELLSQMDNAKKSADIITIKPENVSVVNINISNNIAFIYYNTEYYNMSRIKEVMYRSAVVKTLTQIDDVDYVLFYVNDMPAIYADGTTIGMMTASDFIDDNDNNVNNLEWTNLTLYYANAKGDKLLKNTVSVAYSKNISMERLIVEQLINGPEKSSYYATLPEGLRLLSVSVSSKTCYVNFDSTFSTQIVNVSNEIPIYSIVNSLCELSNIDNVQIMINGDSKKVFRESISLESPFGFNQGIVAE